MKIRLENVNTNKLHIELIEAGIKPSLVESKDNVTWITVIESDIAGVEAVIALHNPAIALTEPTIEDRVMMLEDVVLEILTF